MHEFAPIDIMFGNSPVPALVSSPISRSRAAAQLAILVSCIVVQAGSAETARAGEEAQTNKMCPVMPENPVESQWKTVYKGKTVFFCCNNCVDSFRQNPSHYLDKSPQLATDRNSAQQQSIGLASALFGSSEHSEPGWAALRRTSSRHVLLFVGAVGLLVFGIWRLARRILGTRGSDPRFAVRPVYVEFAICLLVALVVQLSMTKRQLEGEVLESNVMRVVHHATYYDHGYPPVPTKPDLSPQLNAAYYRGNDERSELLFNGGNYLTARFDIAIERSDGQCVEYEQDITGEALFLSFHITRPKHSPERLYGHNIMDRIYLTREYGPLMGWNAPIEDRVPVVSVRDSHYQWHARFPLGVLAARGDLIDPSTVSARQLKQIEGVDDEIASWFVAYRDAGYPIRGAEDLRRAGIEGSAKLAIAAAFGEAIRSGIVYVCEANYNGDRQIGARFHYGIQYELVLRDGLILRDSNIWMGALSRSQKAAKGAIPDEQWLGPRPLPSLPAAQNLSDELLGLDDYPDL